MLVKSRIAAMTILLTCSVAIPLRADVYEDALRHYRANRYTSAIQVLEKKKNRSPGENVLLGWSHLQSGAIEAARKGFTAALTVDSSLPDGHCGLGYSYLRSSEYDLARAAFDRGIVAGPKNVDCMIGKGIALQRQRDDDGAMVWFDKALLLDRANSTALDEKRKLIESRLAASHASAIAEALAAYRGNDLSTALAKLQTLNQTLPGNADVQLALADTRYRTGDNLGAARIYRRLIDEKIATEIATERFLALYGLPSYNEKTPLEPPPPARNSTRQLLARTAGDYFEYFDGKQWLKTYLMGVNLGPARPGEFASTPSKQVSTYLAWFEQMAAMNCNMVRVYTILPPAFYRALDIHNRKAPKPLWLLHEVWLRETEQKNLYSQDWTQEFEQEIRDVIDVIHGRANIAYKRGHAAGVYTSDVSRYTFAIGPGREVEPSIVLVTNRENPTETTFKGKYITVEDGNPTEVWFARMMEFTVGYEMDRYNAQRPLTIINWPPLDPMHHVTEASFAEELEVRRKRGENISGRAPDLLDDADVASVDIMKLHSTTAFPAGLFASYHVYTYWPDFLPYDPEYPKVRDREGSNRYYGYLLELKKHHQGMPLLVAEYGVPSSWGIAHVHPDGWHNGGFSEEAQADLLVRMSRNIYDSGSAGGLVFAWIDEWWKCVADVATNPFDQPPSRRPLWMNMFNPEEHFGLAGYRPVKRVPLLRGSDEDWVKATTLTDVKSSDRIPGQIRRVLAQVDTGYLYLRLDLEKSQAGTTGSNLRQYRIALNTLPGKAGIRRIPQLNVELSSGANFLVELESTGAGSIKIASNYTPLHWIYSDVAPGGKRPTTRAGATASIADTGLFEDIIVEANQPRFGRDGTVFPPINVNRSRLPMGTADPTSPAFSSLAAWHLDETKGMVEVRIPWALLYITDPSSRSAMTGTDKQAKPVWAETPGISVYATVVNASGTRPGSPAGELPSVASTLFTWSTWDEVEYTEYLKESYGALRKIFAELETEFGRQ